MREPEYDHYCPNCPCEYCMDRMREEAHWEDQSWHSEENRRIMYAIIDWKILGCIELTKDEQRQFNWRKDMRRLMDSRMRSMKDQLLTLKRMQTPFADFALFKKRVEEKHEESLEINRIK